MNKNLIYINGVFISIFVCQKTSSWVIQVQRSSLLQKSRTLWPTTLPSYPGIFYEEQSECPEEDECEIDWDLMPGYNDDERKSSDEKEIIEEEPKNEMVTKSPSSVEKSRLILEMNWQIDSCIIDEETCNDFCSECAGSGKTWCKFCRGCKVISFGKEFRTCRICSVDGKTECSACSGTGSISPWAATYEKTLGTNRSLH